MNELLAHIVYWFCMINLLSIPAMFIWALLDRTAP